VRTDPSLSVFHEAPTAREEFTREEIKRCRLLLRRLRFLEAKVRENGGLAGSSGASGWAEMEADALEWILRDNGYLAEPVGQHL